MIGIWTQIKLVANFIFERSIFYRIYTRFNFSVSMKPASIKARYKAFPWKKHFRKAKLYFPANTKKLYFYWFNVRMFYTPPTKTFIAPSVIYQTYFPDYDVLENEERTNAWKLVDGYYYMRWHREFYWYRFRFIRMKTKSEGWQKVGLYPHYLRDKSLQRRPIRHTHMPEWDLLRLLHAMDLLLINLPKKIKWEKKLKKRIRKNTEFNIRVLDRFTFFLHLIFFYPWKYSYHIYNKYCAAYIGGILYYIIYILKFGRKIWRKTAYHRVNWFSRFLLRSLGVLLGWYLPWFLVGYILEIGHSSLGRMEDIHIHANNDFVRRLDCEGLVDRFDELFSWVGQEIITWSQSTTIAFICVQFVMSFSPRLWAYVLAFSDWIGAAATMSFTTMCVGICTAFWDMDAIYWTMPWAGAMLFTLGYHRFQEDFSMFFEAETDQVMLWYDQIGSKLDNVMVDKHLKQLYKNPDWKMTGLSEYGMIAGRTISEDERHLSTHIHSFKILSYGYKFATWRQQHRYLIFFAERFIEYKELPDKDPKAFLYKWMKGAYEFWDQELDNPSNKYEWEFFGDQETTNTSSFTEERRDYWDAHYGEFWQYVIANATLDIGTTSELVENNEFYHVRSPVDGLNLGSATVLFKLFGNNDRDMFHCMYYEPFTLQQAVLNEELLKVWENDNIVTTKLWSKHSIMREYLSRGFKEGSKLGSSPEQTNRNYGFWNEFITIFRDDMLDERVPIFGEGWDSFAVKPGIMVYNAKSLQIYNIGIADHWKPNNLIKFKYDRRRPISTSVRSRNPNTAKNDWDNWTDSQFYHYFVRKTAIQINLIYLQVMTTFQIGWEAFTFKNIATRDWILKELITMKYMNYLAPLEQLYIQYFKTYSGKDLAIALNIWEGYKNLLTTFAPVYAYFNKQEQRKLTNHEWIRHMQNWDDVFHRHVLKSGLEEFWADFQLKNEAWQALTKEKELTESIASKYMILKQEINIITKQLIDGNISQGHWDLVKGSLFLKMEVLEKRTEQLLNLQDKNDCYKNWSRHYHIEVRAKVEFMHRYHFIELIMKPKSPEANFLLKKPLLYTIKEVLTRIFTFRTLAEIRADNLIKKAKKLERKKAQAEKRLAAKLKKEEAYSAWQRIRIKVKDWKMTPEEQKKVDAMPEMPFGWADEDNAKLKPDSESLDYKPYKIKDESEKMFKNREIERKNTKKNDVAKSNTDK